MAENVGQSGQDVVLTEQQQREILSQGEHPAIKRMQEFRRRMIQKKLLHRRSRRNQLRKRRSSFLRMTIHPMWPGRTNNDGPSEISFPAKTG